MHKLVPNIVQSQVEVTSLALSFLPEGCFDVRRNSSPFQETNSNTAKSFPNGISLNKV
jgi:hypothetical protein